MTNQDEADAPPVLEIERAFAAPPALVFRAWSSAEHMRRWFCPAGCSLPVAEIDFRPGGACVFRMQVPNGGEHWMRGHFIEIVADERLVFDMDVGPEGAPDFSVHTIVSLMPQGEGTLLRVRQSYVVHTAAARASVRGAPAGWASTLDNLELEVARIGAEAAHDSFRLEREFPVAPAVLFAAFTDPAAKQKWFGPAGQTVLERVMDVRPGGRERLHVRWSSGMQSCFDAVYFDVVPDRRLVYGYEMRLDGRKISVSLATVEIFAQDAGSRLVLTEQGSFLDGYQDGGARAHGTAKLLEALAASLQS